MSSSLQWKPYDPSWLVVLARESRPEEPWLAEALARCTRAAERSPAYTYFVDPSDPNRSGSAWQFAENVVLEHPREGDLVVDVLRDRSIGGVEFPRRIPLV